MSDNYIIRAAASIVLPALSILDGPSQRAAIDKAERKRRNKAKAIAKASRKRNR